MAEIYEAFASQAVPETTTATTAIALTSSIGGEVRICYDVETAQAILQAIEDARAVGDAQAEAEARADWESLKAGTYERPEDVSGEVYIAGEDDDDDDEAAASMEAEELGEDDEDLDGDDYDDETETVGGED